MNSRGITLIELIVVVSIIAILAVALGFSYVGWQGAYKVERQTKDLYADLMDARGRAMSQNREFFVDFNNPAPVAPSLGTYRLIQDSQNGNGVLDAGDTVLPNYNPKSTEYAMTSASGGPIATITFSRRGIMSPQGTIRVVTTADADYDCIIVAQTRINMGKRNGANCDAK